MDSPIITDEPCGRHRFEGTSPAAHAAVERQREIDAGTGKARNLVPEILALVDRERSLIKEMQTLLEQSAQ